MSNNTEHERELVETEVARLRAALDGLASENRRLRDKVDVLASLLADRRTAKWIERHDGYVSDQQAREYYEIKKRMYLADPSEAVGGTTP